MVGEANEPKGEVTTPEVAEGVTPKETPTLTPEVQALVAKANATLTNVGRLEAEIRRSQSVANAALTRLKEVEEESYRRREEEVKDDPGELARIRRERQDRDRQAKLEERETKVQTQLERLLKVNAKALSTQYNVDEEVLLSFAGEDADNMERLAKSFGERGESKVVRMKEEPDDGRTKGAGAGLMKADIEKMSPEERHRRREEIAAIPF